MTQEEKQLLLKDLCARLPYGVKFQGEDSNVYTLDAANYFTLQVEDVVFKPYLRPMSSMTEEEEKEIQKINWQFCKPNNVLLECFVGNADDGYCSTSQMAGILDYLNAHRFDYRGLIKKGIAIDCTNLNIY